MPLDQTFQFRVYVDHNSSQSQQKELSQEQAELLASYMWGNMIDLNRFTAIVGMGSKNSIGNPNTEEGNL